MISVINDNSIKDPYRLVSRKNHPEDTVVEVPVGKTGKSKKIGGGHFALIGGPCSVESQEQVLSIAKDMADYGASFLRGGAFKARTSPYDFPGLGKQGLKFLKTAGEASGLAIVSEILSTDDLSIFEDQVDIIQIGARNMQNYSLLIEVGKLKKPVLLKRGPSSTIEEFLMSAEYLMKAGTKDVILCERGIRTFETATRNTLDLSAIPLLKEKTHLPVIADPSHGTGLWQLVEPMALAATAAGADGLMIEVHNDPDEALCDGGQSIKSERFKDLAKKVNAIRQVMVDSHKQPENMQEGRDKIDEIDRGILDLFEKRMALVDVISQLKAGENLPVEDLAREEEILEKVAEMVDESNLNDAKALMKSLFEISKNRQR